MTTTYVRGKYPKTRGKYFGVLESAKEAFWKVPGKCGESAGKYVESAYNHFPGK